MNDTKELKININFGLGSSLINAPLFFVSDKLKKSFKNEMTLRQGLKLVLNEYKLKKAKRLEFLFIAFPDDTV